MSKECYHELAEMEQVFEEWSWTPLIYSITEEKHLL